MRKQREASVTSCCTNRYSDGDPSSGTRGAAIATLLPSPQARPGAVDLLAASSRSSESMRRCLKGLRTRCLPSTPHPLHCRTSPSLRALLCSHPFPQQATRPLSAMPGAPDPAAPKRARLIFEPSPVPKNPLGEGRFIRTAAALIIG